jgi:hypothetical protein
MRSLSAAALLLFVAGLVAAPVPFPKKPKALDMAKQALGRWNRISCTGGSFPPMSRPLNDIVTITEDKIHYGDANATWELKLGFEGGQHTFWIRQGGPAGNVWVGLYEVKGDTLRINFTPGRDRPRSIEPSKNGEYLQTFRRPPATK